MATPTDDDNADDCISGDSYRCERGFTLDLNKVSMSRRRKGGSEIHEKSNAGRD